MTPTSDAKTMHCILIHFEFGIMREEVSKVQAMADHSQAIEIK